MFCNFCLRVINQCGLLAISNITEKCFWTFLLKFERERSLKAKVLYINVEKLLLYINLHVCITCFCVRFPRYASRECASALCPASVPQHNPGDVLPAHGGSQANSGREYRYDLLHTCMLMLGRTSVSCILKS